MFFYIPDSYEQYHHLENGRKVARVASSCWYTNLPVAKHNEELICIKHYSPENYPKYDNYNAIDVCPYNDIPCDYDGEMGVPITFLDKLNPEQFEVVGSSLELANPMVGKFPEGTFVKGGPSFYIPDLENPGMHKRLYNRVVIKFRKKPQTI